MQTIETPEAMNGTKTIAAKNERCLELRDLNRYQWLERARMRDVMNNRKAMTALLGKTIKDPDLRLPIANLALRADTVLGQKLGRMPDIKVDPPVSSDTDLARKRADKRCRTVTWLDDECDLEALMPQAGRWVPGYGFTAGVVKQKFGRSKQPLPFIELRDPIQTFPGEWGTNQQPADMAVVHVIGRRKLASMYPAFKDQILGQGSALARAAGGAVLLNADGPGYANQSGAGVEVYEYLDEQGCWWLLPECGLLLEFWPNVVDGPQFRLVKRYAFDELNGAYDGVIGPLANMARLALLATIATEDSVMAETNIVGDLKGDEYRRGRNAVNHFTPGTSVDKMNSRVPFEAFSQIDRIERQLRLAAGHQVADDGESPNSFVTGRGLQELQSSGAAEIREYQMVFSRWLRELDSVRLEYMEKAYGGDEFRINGVRSGTPFAEKMTPERDIKGDYVTRRVYGAMATFDDATTIITGLQLMQGEVIDVDTMRENLQGLENHEKIKERIRANKAEKVAFDTLLSLASQGESKAIVAAIGLLPAGEMRDVLEGVFMSEEEEAAEAAPPPTPEAMPDVMTVLSRLGADGQTEGGSQIVSRVA